MYTQFYTIGISPWNSLFGRLKANCVIWKKYILTTTACYVAETLRGNCLSKCICMFPIGLYCPVFLFFILYIQFLKSQQTRLKAYFFLNQLFALSKMFGNQSSYVIPSYENNSIMRPTELRLSQLSTIWYDKRCVQNKLNSTRRTRRHMRLDRKWVIGDHLLTMIQGHFSHSAHHSRSLQ